MFTAIRDHILMPLLGRVGSIVATGLVTLGAHETMAQSVATGVIALGLIGAELIARRLITKHQVS